MAEFLVFKMARNPVFEQPPGFADPIQTGWVIQPLILRNPAKKPVLIPAETPEEALAIAIRSFPPSFRPHLAVQEVLDYEQQLNERKSLLREAAPRRARP